MVLAVMSVLLSLLLPVLFSVKQQARIVVCSSNLRQIGLAWGAYLAETEGRFPVWRLNMHWFYGGKHPSLATSIAELPYRPLNPFVALDEQDTPGSHLFRCPEDRDIRAGDGSPGPTKGHTTNEYYGNSYPMNFLLLRQFNGIRWVPVSLANVRMDHSLVVMAGDCQWYYSVNDVHWDAHFHNRDDQMNLLFVDGHAAYTQIVRGGAVTSDYSFLLSLPPEEKEED